MLRRAPLAIGVLLASACTEIVGAGEYKVGDGTDVDNPCGPDEVLTDERSCAEVGVPADQCGEGFEPAPSEGCMVVLPEAECTENSFAYPGLPDCAFRP